MIKIVADKYVTEKNIHDFLLIVKELIAESKKETGCISYGIYEDISDKTHLTFIEEWSDEEALKNHSSSEHYKRLLPLLAPLCSQIGTFTKYKEPKM